MGYCKYNDITQTEAVESNNNSSNEGNRIVHSHGGVTLDMYGDWNWKDNINCTISKYDKIIKYAAKKLNLDWRLCAAHCFIESKFNPLAFNRLSMAGGLWQIIPRYWPTDYCPSADKKDIKYIYDPQISTLGYIKVMNRHLMYNVRADRNDQIALALQCWHDGSIGENSPLNWGKRVLGKWGDSNESKEYVPKIINKYREYCKL